MYPITIGDSLDVLVSVVFVQIAGLLSSLVVLLVVVAIGFVFEPLPQVGRADHAELSASCLAAWYLNHFFAFCLVFFCFFTDCAGVHNHGEPGGDVQTVQRHPCSVEDQQDRTG